MTTNSSLRSATDQSSAVYLAERVVEAYESLESGGLGEIESLYADDIYFEDPTHGIQGKAELMRYFERMSKNLESCHFRFHQTLTNDTEVFLSWTMFFIHKRLAGSDVIRVEGSSFLKTRNGKIYYRRDYFDLGTSVYEHLPLVGRIVKRVRQRLGK